MKPYKHIKNINPALLLDGYKLGHIDQYPEGTELVVSNSTPRESRMPGVHKMVVFGNQAYIMKFLQQRWNEDFFAQKKEDVCEEYAHIVSKYLFREVTAKQLEALHDLQYLPLVMLGLPEGSQVPMRVAHTVFYNTHKDFFWLTNFFETIYSAQTWDTATAATIAHEYERVFNKYADETVGNRDFVKWQGHDFSFRGRPNWQAAAASGAGHALSFYGSDTVPVIWYLENFYNANIDKEIIIGSVPATEHSVMCVGTGFYVAEKGGDWKYYGEAELEVFKRLITEVYPTGIVSIVSDTWDFWKVITEYTVQLKDIILARDGKLVFRPDSGIPELIICGDPNEPRWTPEHKGAIECLWDIFSGTETPMGYRLLDSHVGLIYGDSITLERQTKILEGLKQKRFASFNVVLGMGSFTYNYNTRDTFSQAIKATFAIVKGTPIEIFKTPKTDSGMKKSAKGLLAVYKDENGEFYMKEQATWEEMHNCEYKMLFKDGELMFDDTLANIRERLAKG